MQQNKEQQLKEIVPRLLSWYRSNQRILPWRMNQDPYRIWVSEIMLQQTRVDTVIPYYERFLNLFPNIEALADADEAVLLKSWEGLGYYSRVRNMQKAARMIVEEYQGHFPCTYQEILKLPGIGAYTAGAISSIAFELPVPAVDGNVLRVLSRILSDESDIMKQETREEYTKNLAKVYPKGSCGDFTQSLMELGAIVCLPNGAPLCESCPVKALCKARIEGRELDFPIKSAKKERKIESYTVLILQYEDQILLTKREDGLLGGMWQFPNLPGTQAETEIQQWLEHQGAAVREINFCGNQKHIFTHVEWKMKCYHIQLSCKGTLQGTWFTKEQLSKEIMLPTAFGKLRDKIVLN